MLLSVLRLPCYRLLCHRPPPFLQCLFDDSENLSVFLIVLENPLLLRPISFQVVLERIVAGVLALPKSYRIQLFGWLKSYESEYFSRVIYVLQAFLSYVLTNKLGVGGS